MKPYNIDTRRSGCSCIGSIALSQIRDIQEQNFFIMHVILEFPTIFKQFNSYKFQEIYRTVTITV